MKGADMLEELEFLLLKFIARIYLLLQTLNLNLLFVVSWAIK